MNMFDGNIYRILRWSCGFFRCKQSHHQPFKDGLLGTLKLISFPWRNKYEVLRTELGLFKAKAAPFNHVALQCISTFFWRHLGHFWSGSCAADSLLESFCKVAAIWVLCDVGIHSLSTKCGQNLCSAVISTRGLQIPPAQCAVCLLLLSHPAITPHCFIQSLTYTIALPQTSAAPFIRNRGLREQTKVSHDV